MLPPGAYAIINKKSGTVLDLSGIDGRSIIGYDYHGGDNQKWILTPFNASDSTWEISSMSDRVSIDVQDSPIPGARVVASPDPAIWQIREVEGDPDHFHISFLDTPLNISLADDGSSENDTPVELAIHSSDASQMWKFQPV